MAEKKKKKSNHKLSIFLRMVLWLNYLAIIALVGSYLASFLSPVVFWPVAFLGISYPFILIINLFFVLFWMIAMKKQFLISLIFILVGWNYMGKFIRFKSDNHGVTVENGIKIMSYNVKGFQVHHWFKEKSSEKYHGIIKMIDSVKPAILCMQEYYSYKNFNAQDSIKKFHNYPYCHIAYYGKGSTSSNMALFSDYPIVNKAVITVNDSSRVIGIISDLVINGDTVRVINVHLQSIRLGNEEELFTSELDVKSTEDQQLIKKDTKKIASKLKNAFKLRAEQAVTISEEVENSPYPVILCGDFNDTPSSYAYKMVSSELHDGFIESGKGTGQTYAGKFPSFRIDYILYGNYFKSYNFTTGKKDYSDHYPVWCELKVKK